ncbi:MAG TPA: D-aminoacylase [Streptosporangiaceae bacterium]|nr:D-aminoacylase [Streptosporangiaceae bacterium]
MTASMGSGGRILIKGAEVADGTGGPVARQDILLSGGRIEASGPPGAYDSADCQVIVASGLVVAPGFIDVHSHADNAPLLDDDDTSKILQGVTTEVTGNCGFSLAPVDPAHDGLLASFASRLFPPLGYRWRSFADFLRATDARGYVTNYAPLVGHGTLRLAVLGMADRQPDGGELDRMGRLLGEALDAGAFGMSTGLIYPPGVFAATSEIIELAKRLRGGRMYATHMRGEGAGLLASVDEAVAIGAGAGCRVEISHLKASGRQNWGSAGAALERLDRARRDGVAVTHDVYPYDRASTILTTCLPPWFQEGGDAAVLARLDDPAALDRARAEMEDPHAPGWDSALAGAGYGGILISSTASHRFEGQTLAEIAGELGTDGFGAFTHVLRAEKLRVSMVIASMSEPDVETVLAHPSTMIGSDGLPPGTGGRPHPRMFGTFPRVLRRYVRERGVLGLPEAIHRMTGLPADTFGIPGRGRVAPGAVADLVAFDPRRITDVCDYRDPVHPPSGIAWVMQAGRFAVRDGRWLGTRLGTRLEPAPR